MPDARYIVGYNVAAFYFPPDEMMAVRRPHHRRRDIFFISSPLRLSGAAKLIKEQQQQDGRSIRAHCSLLMDQCRCSGAKYHKRHARRTRRSGSHQPNKKRKQSAANWPPPKPKVGRNPSPRHADQLVHFLSFDFRFWHLRNGSIQSNSKFNFKI